MSTWSLEAIYPSEEDFKKDVSLVKGLLKSSENIQEWVLRLQEAGKILKELESYVECLRAQNTADPNANMKNGEVSDLLSNYEAALFSLGNRLAKMEEKSFSRLIIELQEIAFFLEEMRARAKEKASVEKEEVINALSTDGYHSLWSLYQTYTGKIKIGKKGLSIGQAYNLLTDPDRKKRIEAFHDWEKAWEEHADFLGQILNHIGGFRLKVYAIRGWDDILFEPLHLNRMKRETLEAMWKAVEEAKPAFLSYLKRKAEILGLKKLSWVDVSAPLNETKQVKWDEACELILEQFGKFHPKKAAFVKKSLKNNWVEAKDRPGKAAGGFCVSFPKSCESRIFMTFKGTANNVATLAHEFGHAYHNSCMEHLPYFHQQAQMNVAETASTFGEMVVIDQTIRNAKNNAEKLQLLDDKLERSVAYFMDLHARQLFEKSFYAERKEGFVSTKRLCELMVAAQKEAFHDSLSDWDPYFWASKLHFFYTHFPFYNFPYTFGYLLSNGLYIHSKKKGFGEKLDAFLEDTAQMQVEDLARKHLGVDLTQPNFWRESTAILKKDIEEFLQLSKSH